MCRSEHLLPPTDADVLIQVGHTVGQDLPYGIRVLGPLLDYAGRVGRHHSPLPFGPSCFQGSLGLPKLASRGLWAARFGRPSVGRIWLYS